MSAPRDTISAAIRACAAGGRPALVAYMTAGFPDRASFERNLAAIGAAADVVELGVPFSDPMADGMTIQRASHVSLAGGFTLTWLLETLAGLGRRPRAPLQKPRSARSSICMNLLPAPEIQR